MTGSVSGQCCEVKQHRARLVAGWVTQALEQRRLGSCSAHAGYHQYYISVGRQVFDELMYLSIYLSLLLALSHAIIMPGSANLEF